MTKVYIVNGFTDLGENTLKQETLYAGINERIAFDVNIDLPYIQLTLEVWIDNTLINSYIKTNTWTWDIVFNKLNELENKKFDLQTDIDWITDQIEDLKKLIK